MDILGGGDSARQCSLSSEKQVKLAWAFNFSLLYLSAELFSPVSLLIFALKLIHSGQRLWQLWSCGYKLWLLQQSVFVKSQAKPWWSRGTSGRSGVFCTFLDLLTSIKRFQQGVWLRKFGAWQVLHRRVNVTAANPRGLRKSKRLRRHLGKWFT